MSTAKKILIILGVIIAVIALIIGLAFYLTSNLPRTADSFFSLIAQGKTLEAYKATAKGFQTAMDQDAFNEFLGETDLSNFSSASWSSRSIEGGRGLLEGTVILKDGRTIPLKIELIKENGTWKIFSITIPKAGLKETFQEPREEETEELKEEEAKEEEIEQYLPVETEAKKIARETLIIFAEAVKEKDFTTFYESISSAWQKQTNSEEIYSAFESFITNEVNLERMPSASIELTEAPFFDEDGLLVLRGKALDVSTTTEINLSFELSYIFEQGNWELFGIHIKTL